MRVKVIEDKQLSQSTGQGLSGWLFLGKHGLRTGWSVLLFVGLYLLLENAAVRVFTLLVVVKSIGLISPFQALLHEYAELVAVLSATYFMSLVEGRRIAAFGYGGKHKLLRVVSGAAWGFVCLSALIAVLWRCRFMVFDGISLNGLTVLKYGIEWALIFVMVGLFEESLLRGYLQFALSRGVGFWWAALLLSLAFALLHAANGGESLLGLVVVLAGGLVFCLSLWYTGSLWWAIGFHASWDWGQSFFYGTPNSGLRMEGHLFSEHVSGTALWSGGSVGPEGSLLLFPLLVLVAVGMWIWWGRLQRRSSLMS